MVLNIQCMTLTCLIWCEFRSEEEEDDDDDDVDISQVSSTAANNMEVIKVNFVRGSIKTTNIL